MANPSAGAFPAMTPSELEALIRRVVHEELAESAGGAKAD
jgi:hypothetical protein